MTLRICPQCKKVSDRIVCGHGKPKSVAQVSFSAAEIRDKLRTKQVSGMWPRGRAYAKWLNLLELLEKAK